MRSQQPMTLNIAEAEKRARTLLTAGKAPVGATERQTLRATLLSQRAKLAASDFLALAALYREAVEALDAVVKALRVDAAGTVLNSRKYDALGAQALAVLAKARAAGLGGDDATGK